MTVRVYHLSEQSYALSNIALRRIRLSRFADLNDPFELLGADLRDKHVRELFRQAKDELHKTTGLLCFSKAWGNPVLWSHYAEKHRGICLGFDVSDKILKSVTYTDKPKKIAESDATVDAVVNSLLLTKYVGWQYEDEVRMVLPLDPKSAESGNYYCSFSENLALREVILGPRCELPIRKIRELVSAFVPEVYVVKARIAFTKFKVVENKDARLSRLRETG